MCGTSRWQGGGERKRWKENPRKAMTGLIYLYDRITPIVWLKLVSWATLRYTYLPCIYDEEQPKSRSKSQLWMKGCTLKRKHSHHFYISRINLMLIFLKLLQANSIFVQSQTDFLGGTVATKKTETCFGRWEHGIEPLQIQVCFIEIYNRFWTHTNK